MDRLNQLEDQIEKPGYLLFVVSVLILLIIGFVNLLARTSRGAIIFDSYSIGYFVMLIAYFVGMCVWTSLLWRPNNDRWLQTVMGWIQSRPAVGIAVFIGLVIALFSPFIQHRQIKYKWTELPALQAVVIGMALILGGMLLFYKWEDDTKPKLWRKAIITLLAAVVVVELIMQLLSVAGVLPGLTTVQEGLSPFSRIYYKDEGVSTHAIANSNGMHLPERLIADDAYKIMVTGDGSLRGLQVAPEENLNYLLAQMVESSDQLPENAQIAPFPTTDHGPGVYMGPLLYEISTQPFFEPDEVIVFFDFRNDFQAVMGSNGRDLYFFAGEEGLELSRADSALRHDYMHDSLYTLEGMQPGRYLQSHILTPRVIGQWFPATAEASDNMRIDAPQDDVSLPNSFAFYDDLNDESMYIALETMREFNEAVVDSGAKLRFVTIPVFSDEFYAQGDTAEWTTEFGEADLFLPERELRALAEEEGISFLAMGDYMQEMGLTTADIQALYLENGRGHFSAAGHEFFAQATYDCFYGQAVDTDGGCDNR